MELPFILSDNELFTMRCFDKTSQNCDLTPKIEGSN